MDAFKCPGANPIYKLRCSEKLEKKPKKKQNTKLEPEHNDPFQTGVN